MAVKEWSTDYPTTQDPDPITTNQPDLTDETYQGANDGDALRSSHPEALRDKLQAVAKYVGDASELPATSLRATNGKILIETSGPDTLDMGAVEEDEYLKRDGTDIVGEARIRQVQERASTSDATPLGMASALLPEKTACMVKLMASGYDTNDTDRAGYCKMAMVYRVSGVAAVGGGGVVNIFTDETDAAWQATIGVQGNNVRAVVTGKAGQTIWWHCVLEITEAYSVG